MNVLRDSFAEARRIEDVLFERAQRSADATAIVASGQSYSYADVAARVTSFALRLRHEGLRDGNRVGVFLQKTLDCVVAIFATWSAGGIVVPINESLRAYHLRHILDDSGCTILVSSKRMLSAVDRSTVRPLTVLSVDYGVDEIKRRSGKGGRHPAAILYTSGSSGRPKGILLSHDNLLAGSRIVADYLGIRPDDRILSVVPFSFDYGLNQLLVSVEQGACCVLQRSTLPADVCRSLEQQEITVLAGVPPFWMQMMQVHSPLADMNLPRLRILTNTGGVFPETLLIRYRRCLPDAKIFLMYGLTEAFRSTYLPPDELLRRPGSIGLPIPETEVFVINDHGRECGDNEVGELVHVGPTVALGYWNNAQETRRVFRSHPLERAATARAVYSGDLVRRDAEGYLYFVGRRDEMIKSMGYRLSPDDIEEQLRRSGLIAEVVVGGKPDELAGQVVVAHIVPAEPNTFSPDELMEFCRREMAGYMIPAQITVHATLPRTSSGKLDRVAVLA